MLAATTEEQSNTGRILLLPMRRPPTSGALPFGRRSSIASAMIRPSLRSLARRPSGAPDLAGGSQLVIKSKAEGGQTRPMNTSERLTPGARDRAVVRMRRLTVSTALASAAAVGIFGAVAAISNPGDTAAKTAIGDSTTAGSTTAGSRTTSTTSSTMDSATTTLQPAPTAATATTGRGQVTTGAS